MQYGTRTAGANRLDAVVPVRQCESSKLVDSGNIDHDSLENAFGEVVAALPTLTLDNADQLASSAHNSLQGRMSNEQRKVNDASDKMIAGMSDFLNHFPEFKQTLQPGRDYARASLRRSDESRKRICRSIENALSTISTRTRRDLLIAEPASR